MREEMRRRIIEEMADKALQKAKSDSVGVVLRHALGEGALKRLGCESEWIRRCRRGLPPVPATRH